MLLWAKIIQTCIAHNVGGGMPRDRRAPGAGAAEHRCQWRVGRVALKTASGCGGAYLVSGVSETGVTLVGRKKKRRSWSIKWLFAVT